MPTYHDPHPRLTGARWEAALARKGHNVTSHLNESGPCLACGIGAPFAFSVVSYTDEGDVSVDVYPTRERADARFDRLADELATRSAEELESGDRREADAYYCDFYMSGIEDGCDPGRWVELGRAHLPGGGIDTGVTVELRAHFT